MWQSAETGPEVESVERPKRFGVAMLLEQLFGLLYDRATERINNKALPAVGLEVPVTFSSCLNSSSIRSVPISW